MDVPICRKIIKNATVWNILKHYYCIEESMVSSHYYYKDYIQKYIWKFNYLLLGLGNILKKIILQNMDASRQQMYAMDDASNLHEAINDLSFKPNTRRSKCIYLSGGSVHRTHLLVIALWCIIVLTLTWTPANKDDSTFLAYLYLLKGNN